MSDADQLRAARKDPEAFAGFYRAHGDWVFRWVRMQVEDAETAMDITAETFAQALLSVRRFRGREPGTGTAWVFGIARNLVRRYFERRRVEAEARIRVGMPLTSYEPDEYLEADERLDADALAGEIADALGYLPTELRRTLEARVVGGLEYGEIASTVGITEANARMRVARGLRALRARLKPKELEL